MVLKNKLAIEDIINSATDFSNLSDFFNNRKMIYILRLYKCR